MLQLSMTSLPDLFATSDSLFLALSCFSAVVSSSFPAVRHCLQLTTPDTYDGADDAMSGEEDEHNVLLRATQGDDKFSTRVSHDCLSLAAFSTIYPA